MSRDAGGSARPSDHNCCLDRAAVTMRGISASRVAALSQFTQAPSPCIFPLYTHVQASVRVPNAPLPRTTVSPVVRGNCSNTKGGAQPPKDTCCSFKLTRVSSLWLPGRMQSNGHRSLGRESLRSRETHSKDLWLRPQRVMSSNVVQLWSSNSLIYSTFKA